MMAEKVTIGNCELWHGDCREILPTLPKVDLVLTDPPYGIAHETGFKSEWQGQIANDCDVSCRDSALAMLTGIPALVFGSWKKPKPIGTRALLIWSKGPALGMGAMDIPWKPTHEEIYVLGRGWTGRTGADSVIYCPPVQSMAKNGRVHPNEKPIALLEKLLNESPVGIVLDPFMGAGSTGVACVRLGRTFVGIEIERKYFDIACRRIEQAYAQPRLFEDAKVGAGGTAKQEDWL